MVCLAEPEPVYGDWRNFRAKLVLEGEQQGVMTPENVALLRDQVRIVASSCSPPFFLLEITQGAGIGCSRVGW